MADKKAEKVLAGAAKVAEVIAENPPVEEQRKAAEAMSEQVPGKVALSWDQFAFANARRGAGRKDSKYAAFVKGLEPRTPTDASYVFPKVDIRTLRGAIAKVARELKLKVRTVIMEGHLVVAYDPGDPVQQELPVADAAAS